MKIAVIGRGNVATHLIDVIKQHNDRFQYAGSYTRPPETIPSADIYIVSVSDDAIKSVTATIKDSIPTNAVVLHTSGSRDINEIDSGITCRGVLYPLQTFSKGIKIDMKRVPIFIESYREEDRAVIEELAEVIGGEVRYCDSMQRREIHVMAVFVCNFVTHILSIGQQLAKEGGVDFSCLKPLIEESFRKVMSADDIASIQTGPAVRGDMETIEEHLKLLREVNSDFADIYKSLTDSIINNRNNRE